VCTSIELETSTKCCISINILGLGLALS
jgi:hypothetical protein